MKSRIFRKTAIASCVLSLTILSAQGGASPSSLSGNMSTGSVTIKRDTFGTPHLYAANDYDLYYGYGYVLAEDRLYQLEILKRSTQGKVAEVLGREYVAFDRKQRSLFWPDDIKKGLMALTQDQKDLFKGFAAGINARIATVQGNPKELMPKEFIVNGFSPELWSDYDVVMMFVGSMLLRFGDFNSELENQTFLADLLKSHSEEDAWKIFNAVIPQTNSHAPTTIPAEDWQKTINQAALGDIAKPDELISDLSSYSRQSRGQAFSNALILGPERLQGATSVLINGPQFGWYTPAYTYSVGFHSPNWNAVGNAPLGYPLPMFGYNSHITWGSTWAVMDNVDVFRETLNPENGMQYKHKGEWKNLRSRDEVIRVKGGADVPFKVFATIHGPVVYIDEQQKHAYAKQRGWAGRELATLTGWIEATRARNHEEWLKAVKKSALNVNWYFADRKGNIAYGSMGSYPVREAGHDNRLPVSGEGDMDWLGIQPASENPQILNPSSHYIANWNNQPGSGVQNPDEWWMSWSEADRVKIIDDAVEKAGKMTAEQAWQLMMRASFVDPNATYFRPHMMTAIEKNSLGNPQYEDVLKILQDWDGTTEKMMGDGTANSAGNGYSHPGNAIFQAWLSEMMVSVLADDLPGEIGRIVAHSSGYGSPDKPLTGGHNISVGAKLLYEILQKRIPYDFLNGEGADDLWRAALDKTLAQLTEKYGTDMQAWHLPVPATRFTHVNFLGIPQALPASQRDDMPAMNRGTENNMTIFSQEGITGYEVVPPGQSGFISPTGEKAKHYDDQYLMYQALQKKRTWLARKDVDANLEKTYTLTITRP